MAWSYRRRIKIIPGVHLNLSKKGISTSIGVKGASITFGKQGTYLNTSIPGAGVYSRRKIFASDNSSGYVIDSFQNQSDDGIFSRDVQQITSQDMRGIKEAIAAANRQRAELKHDLLKVKASLWASKFRLIAGYIFVVGLLKNSIRTDSKVAINGKRDAINQLTREIENCYVQLDIDFDLDIKRKYDRVIETFRNLCNSKKIWDVTNAKQEDTRITRSPMSTRVKKTEVRFGIKAIEDIKSMSEPLLFKNANGADLYVYPNFIVMYTSRSRFALIGLNEIHFSHMPIRFVENGPIPNDTKVIDRTWSKVNKDGSPDRRFKSNSEIPVVRYGQINLKTDSGLNEEYEFSNYEYSEQFSLAFLDFQKIVKGLKQLP